MILRILIILKIPMNPTNMKLFFILFTTLLSTSLFAQRGNNSQKPNIIFILTDDQRWDALGYAGNNIIQTPEMDRLAKQGYYFKNALVTTPICAASRASILTGLYERMHGFTFQTGPIGEVYMDKAYPKLLKEAGYYTGFFGKYGVQYENTAALFDEFDSYDRNGRFGDKRGYFYKTLGEDTVHLTRYTGQQALDFLDNRTNSEPFCLSLSFSAPHAHDNAELQYFWQAESDKLHQKEDMPGPLLAGDNYFNALPESVRNGFNRTRWYWRYDTPEKYQHSVKGYYRMIAGIDRELGKIRAKLKAKGIDKNTIIILMGDNGYFLGERQLAGKWLMYDNSIRVPLIIYDPRKKGKTTIEEMALNIDVPATMLDAAGLSVPESYQGKSLLPLIGKEVSSLNRDTVLVEHLWYFENIPPSEGLRTKDWKYLRYREDKSIEELYHLKNDPQEKENLAKEAQYQEVLSALRRKCDELIVKNADPYSAPPQDLMVEYIRQPEKVEIKDATPEFSWQIPAKVKEQVAYHILVASSEENIQNNVGNMWDTKRVVSDNSTNIEYAGKALESGQSFFWKVRIWDNLNRKTAYSAHQKFSIGELDSLLTTPNFFVIDSLKPSTFEKREEAYFTDFSKDAFGTLKLNYKTDKKDSLIIRLGERMENDTIDSNPPGHVRFQEVTLNVSPEKTEYILSLPPDKRNTNERAVALPDSFPVVIPFRYVEILNAKQAIKAADVTQLAYHTYFDEAASSFTSSDPILNQVWEMCKYTMKATTFSGLYVDGDRERIPYEADAYIQQLGHYSVDKEYAMARATIEYFMEQPTWPTEWQQHMALMFYQDYMYTGNLDLVAHYYEELKYKTLMGLDREDGLISTKSPKLTGEFMQKLGFADTTARLRDIIDWPPAQKDTGWQLATAEGERDGYVFKPINTVVNCFYYENLKIMEHFAKALDKPFEAMEFALKAAQVKLAINQKLLDKERGVYVDGEGTEHASLHANMMAMAFGIVPDIYKDSVLSFIKSRGMACSVYGSQYLMEALYNAGAADYALELMTAQHDRSWYNMIKVGATMAMEAWDMKYKPNADWNHAWGAVPANIIPRGLWGVKPLEPGFELIQIKPQMGDLEESEITIPSIKGQIKGTYKKVSARKMQYEIDLPPGIFAEFVPSQISGATVYLNAKKVDLRFGSIRLTPGENTIDLTVLRNNF